MLVNKFDLFRALTSTAYFFIYFKKVYENPPTGTFDTYFIIFAVTLSFTMMIILLLFLGFHTR